MDRPDDAARLREIIECQREIMACGPDRERVMRLITERTQALTGASSSIIEIREGEFMVYRAASGAAADALGTRLDVHASFSGRCAHEGKTLYCPDTELDETVDLVTCRRLDIRSMLVLPLLHGNSVVGVLKVASHRVDAFDEQHIATLELMTGFLSAALAHASEHEAAQRSVEMFENAFRYAGVGMALMSLEGRWVRVNDAMCKIVGYTRPKLLKTDFQSITHPDDLEGDLQRVGRLLRGEMTSYESDKRYIHADGHVVFAGVTVSLVRDVAGVPLFFVAQVQDLTLRKRAESEVHAFFGMSPNLLAIVGSDASFESVNPAWTRLLGWTERELMMGSFLDFVHPDDLAATERELEILRGTGTTTSGFRNRYRAQDGSYRWLEWNTRSTNGRTYCDARDVTHQREHEEREVAQSRALVESEQRFRALSEGSVQGIVVSEPSGESLLYVNDAAAKMFGFAKGSEMCERSTLFSLMPHHSRRAISTDWMQLTRGERDYLHERLELQRIDGRPLWVDLVASRISWDGGLALQITMIDASAQVALEQTLSRQATTDSLTGLCNRRLFERLAHETLAEGLRNDTPVSLLMLDLDHFKSINDRYGHAGGDHALRAFANVVESALAGRGIAARWGGEEFVVLLPQVALATARDLADQIRQRWMSHEVETDHARFSGTVSIGVSEQRAGERVIADLLERADRALYEAKRGGRNNVRVAANYEPASLEAVTTSRA